MTSAPTTIEFASIQQEFVGAQLPDHRLHDRMLEIVEILGIVLVLVLGVLRMVSKRRLVELAHQRGESPHPSRVKKSFRRSGMSRL